MLPPFCLHRPTSLGLGLRGCCVSSPPESALGPLTQVAYDDRLLFVDTEMVEVAGNEGCWKDRPGFFEHLLGRVASADMVQHQLAHASTACQACSSSGCQMAVLAGQRLVGLEIGGFDHEQIGPLGSCLQRACVADISDKKEARPALGRAQDLFWLHHTPTGQDDRLPLGQVTPFRPVGHPQPFGSFSQKGTMLALLEEKTEAIGPTMGDRDRRQRKFFVPKELPGLEQGQGDTGGWDLARAKDNLHQQVHTRQGHGPAVDVELLQRLPAPQSRSQPAQPKDMVEMPMGQQNFIQPAKAKPGAQELALRALSTVDHEAMLVYHHQRRG